MISLAEALYALPTERLRVLVQTRNIDKKKLAPVASKRQLVEHLAVELNASPSVTAAMLQCSVRELRLLQLLLPGESNRLILWSSVVEAAGGPALSAALSEVMTRLEELGLAFRMPGGVLLPEAVRAQIPASTSDHYRLVQCLNTYDAPTLKCICDNLGLRTELNTKAANIAAIRTRLLDNGPGMGLSEPLDEEEIAVLDYMIQAGGTVTAIEVASAVLPRKTNDFFRYDWQNRWKLGRERNGVDRLLARGILYVVSHGLAYNLFLLLPGDLMRVLTGTADAAFWTGPLLAPDPLAEAPAAVTRCTALTRDAVSLLAFLTSQEAVRTNTGHIHRTSLKNLARLLSLPDERYAGFLYAVCREAKLIAPHGEKQVYAPTAKGHAWLQWDSSVQTCTLFEAWREGTAWTEMYSDPLGKANEYRPAAEIRRMRRAVLQLLAENAADTFVDIGSLAETLAFRYPLLLAESSELGSDLVASPTVFVRLLIEECLTWLGAVELAREPEETAARAIAPKAAAKPRAGTGSRIAARGKPAHKAAVPDATACRLTPLGAYLLGIAGTEPPAAEPREDTFILQANAEIFVPPYLEPAILYRLLTLTEPPTRGASGHTVSLTRDSVRRALDRDETLRPILAFLQAHARTGIPQNVEYMLNEVGGKHGHIHVGQAQMYLQAETPLLLQELQARRELKPYFVRAITDTVAILRADDPDKVLRDLRKAGYLPVSDDVSQESFMPSETYPPPQGSESPARRPQAGVPAQAEVNLDWERIARDDNKPWSLLSRLGRSFAPEKY